MPPSITLLRRAFVDVCAGHSVGRLDGRTVYIRHLGHREHASFEDVQADFEAHAKAQGALTEAQRLDQLYPKGQWSPAREADIELRRERIGRMEEGRKSLAVPSLLRGHDEHIARERADLAKVLNERAQVIGITVESDAARRLEDHYLVHNLFTDSELTTVLHAPEAFDALTDAEVDAIHATYAAAIEPCAEANLRRLSVQDWFVSYWSLASDDARSFYGRAICDLTYYQVRLAGQARYMKALLDNTDLNRLPADKRGDPDAIEQLHIVQKNAATMAADGRTPIAMTAADIKETGQRFDPLPPPNLSGVELVKWMRKNQSAAPR